MSASGLLRLVPWKIMWAASWFLLPTSQPVVGQENNAVAAKPQQTIRISEETTRITKPLDREGYIDYVAAINDRQSKGVTPQNNFEVVVRSVMPLDSSTEEFRAEYFRRLDINPVPSGSFTYRDFITYTSEGETVQKSTDELFDEFDVLTTQPWRATEHPAAAKWVAAFDSQLDQIVAGSRRSRFYTPYIADELDPDEPLPRVLAMLLPTVQQQREVARGLMIRAMGRIGGGNLDGAWSDLQAMHRVAHHVAHGFTLVEWLVGIAIDSMAFQAEKYVLQSADLTTEQTRRFLADLNALPPFPSVAEKIDVGERYSALDAAIAVARHAGRHGLIRMLSFIESLSDAADLSGRKYLLAVARGTAGTAVSDLNAIDWNVALVVLNKWYDRLAAASREADFAKRKELLGEIRSDLSALSKQIQSTEDLVSLIQEKGAATAIGRKVGELLVALLLPSVQTACNSADVAQSKRDVVRIGFALELFRRVHGTLPEHLTELAPEILPTIPADACSGVALRYLQEGGSGLVYSVGRNSKDDNGRTYDDAHRTTDRTVDWDDIVIHVHRR